MTNVKKTLAGQLEERDHFEDVGVYGRIKLKSILKEYGVRFRNEFIWLKTGPSGGIF
jgi:hypothetical protein